MGKKPCNNWRKIKKMLEGKNNSLKSKLIHDNYFDFALLTNTAWEAAKSTNIISEFDFETTKKLIKTYTLQKMLTDKIIMKIVDFLYNMETHKKENIDATLVQFHLRFRELIDQEYSMEYLYENAIDMD